MLTARDLIDSNTSIAVICASIKTEPGYRSLQDVRKGWRKRKVNALKQERVKLERGAGAGRDLVEELHVQEEQVLRPVDVTEEVVGAQETEQGGEEEEDGFSAAFDDEDEDGSEPRAL